VTLALILAALQMGMQSASPQPVCIGSIEIESLDVFSPQEAAKGGFYRVANVVHIQTRDDFLRKQLLFQEGDPLDPAKLAETERNLRALPFIKSASVTASPPEDGVVTVHVLTQDTWSLQFGGSYGSSGGVTTYGAQIQENNFLGEGDVLGLSYDKGTVRTTRIVQFQDPYLFRPFWTGQLLYGDNSDGQQAMVGLARPFFSYTAPWSTALLLEKLRQQDYDYLNGYQVSTYSQLHREQLYSYGHALEATTAHALRLTGGYNVLDDDFTTITGQPAPVVPENRQFHYIFLGLQTIGNNFLTLNYVNRDSRYEDFNLASGASFKVAVSPILLGAPHNSEFLSADFSGGFSFGPHSFLQADLSGETRFNGGPENSIVSLFLGYANVVTDARYPRTFVARIQFDHGWDLDKDLQFAADGITGMRGYHLHAMTGNKRLILNLEERFSSGKEILQLITPGAAVFVDTGTALPEFEQLQFSRMRVDAGVGLRFAIARAASAATLRLDFAYAFVPDPRGRRGFLFSFSASQAFPFARQSPSGE
jgi:outer membrane protein assembly factor BamA